MEWADRGEKFHLSNFILTADEVMCSLLQLAAQPASKQDCNHATDPENS